MLEEKRKKLNQYLFSRLNKEAGDDGDLSLEESELALDIGTDSIIVGQGKIERETAMGFNQGNVDVDGDGEKISRKEERKLSL